MTDLAYIFQYVKMDTMGQAVLSSAQHTVLKHVTSFPTLVPALVTVWMVMLQTTVQ